MARIYHRPGAAEDSQRSRLGVGCLAKGLALSLLVGAGAWLVLKPEAILSPQHLIVHPPLSQPVKVLYTVLHLLAFVIFPTAVWAALRRWHVVSASSQRTAAAILGACFFGFLGWEIALGTLLPEVRKRIPPLFLGDHWTEVQVSPAGPAAHFSPLWKVLWFAGLVFAFMVVGCVLGHLGPALARPLRLGRRGDEEQAATELRPNPQTGRVVIAVFVGVAAEMVALLVFSYGWPDSGRPLRDAIWAGHVTLTAKLLCTAALLLGLPSLLAYVAYLAHDRLWPY